MNSRHLAPFVALALIVAGCSSGGDADGATAGSTAPIEDASSTTDPADPQEADDAATSEPTDQPVEVEAELTVEASPHIGLAAEVSVASGAPVQAEVTAISGDHVVDVPRTSAMDTDLNIPLVGMRAEQTYEISASLFDEDGMHVGDVDGAEFTTSALPEWFDEHEVTVDADRAAPGYTIIEFDAMNVPEGAPSSQHLMAYDDEGEVVWYYTNTGAVGGVERTPAGTFNTFYWPFGIREIDLVGNVVNNWRPQPADTSGEVDDERTVEDVDPDQVEFQGGLQALEGNAGDAEPVAIRAEWMDLAGVHHESWPMPNGNILTLSTTIHELTPEQRATFCPGDPAPFDAISDVAVEFEPSGRVVRTWDLWDVIDIDEFPGGEMCVDAGIFAEENTRDWTHANSAIYDPERDAIIVSSRHTDQIVAFDHLDDEGPQSQLRWILGAGATIPFDGEPSYYQHAVEVNDDGSLILYDNGNFRPGTSPDDPENLPYSRAVIYEVDDGSDDPADWSATQRWENVDVVDGIPAYSSFISDADMLENGNVLVTHGGIGTFPPTPDDPLRIVIREVVPEGDSGGDVVWELRSAPGKVYVTYRAERIPSFYFGPDWET
ncbi:aryl-sulfate sulfotransferase [Ilumatobacter nonamiensis]|uniref:aryl-sulfate sulfotransferase n=1 Tax=Ilumatobacter nonamiensis TaxID=467093 RepID=UPI00034D3506|nr:aryl-sulfate sulfotransferase [Ilumatobacter nonamiensis]